MSRLEQLKAEKARREQERIDQQPSEYPLKQEAQTAPTPMPTPQPQAPQMPQPANRLEMLKAERDKRNANRPVKQEMHEDVAPYRAEVKMFLDTPDQYVQALKTKLPQHDIQNRDGQVVIRRKDEKEYRVLDPSSFQGGFTEMGRDISDLAFEAPSLIVSGATGAIGGALAGPPGAIAGVGIGEGIAETAKQAIAKEKGFRENFDKSQIALATALGTVAGPAFGLVGKAFKGAGKLITKPFKSLFPKKDGAYVSSQLVKVSGIGLNDLSKLATRAETDAGTATGDHLSKAILRLRTVMQKPRMIKGVETNLLTGNAKQRAEAVRIVARETRDQMNALFKGMDKINTRAFSPKIAARVNLSLIHI